MMPLLDGLVALLLMVCIGYCVKLNKKIMALHKNKNDFAKGLKYFDDAILRAETSIVELRNVSNKVVVDLQHTIEKANHILNDLSFMADRAANLTDKLELSIRDARTVLTSPAMHLLTKDDRYDTPSKQQHLMSAPENDSTRAVALQSLLERISAAKDSQKKKVASHHFEQAPSPKQAPTQKPSVNGTNNFLKTLRTLSREDPI